MPSFLELLVSNPVASESAATSLAIGVAGGVALRRYEAAVPWALSWCLVAGAIFGHLLGFGAVKVALILGGFAILAIVPMHQVEFLNELRQVAVIDDWSLRTWRAALQAGIGAGVGGLAALPEFGEAAFGDLSFRKLLVVAIGTVIAMTLAVPIHLRIEGHHAEPEAEQPDETPVRDRFRRAALVYAGLLLVEYFNSAVEHTIERDEWSVGIVLAGVFVAFAVTYYWATTPAAYGRNNLKAFMRSMIFGTFWVAPFVLALVFPLRSYFAPGSSGPQGLISHDQGAMLISWAVVALLVTCISLTIALVLFGFFSLFGLLAMQHGRRHGGWQFYALLTCSLVAAGAAQIGLFAMTPWVTPAQTLAEFRVHLFPALMAAGWGLGLWVGDFESVAGFAGGARDQNENE